MIVMIYVDGILIFTSKIVAADKLKQSIQKRYVLNILAHLTNVLWLDTNCAQNNMIKLH